MKDIIMKLVFAFVFIVLFQITFCIIGATMEAPVSFIFFMAGMSYMCAFDIYEKAVEGGVGYLKSFITPTISYVVHSAVFFLVTFFLVIYHGGDVDFSKGFDKLNQIRTIEIHIQ